MSHTQFNNREVWNVTWNKLRETSLETIVRYFERVMNEFDIKYSRLDMHSQYYHVTCGYKRKMIKQWNRRIRPGMPDSKPVTYFIPTYREFNELSTTDMEDTYLEATQNDDSKTNPEYAETQTQFENIVLFWYILRQMSVYFSTEPQFDVVMTGCDYETEDDLATWIFHPDVLRRMTHRGYTNYLIIEDPQMDNSVVFIPRFAPYVPTILENDYDESDDSMSDDY